MATVTKKKKPKASSPSVKERAAEVLKFARRKAKTINNWAGMQNALFGPGGKALELFPNKTERTAFLKTSEYKEIEKLLDDKPFPGGKAGETSGREASGRVLVRLPKSLHAALGDEAEREGVSLNQLMLAKLAVQLNQAVK